MIHDVPSCGTGPNAVDCMASLAGRALSRLVSYVASSFVVVMMMMIGYLFIIIIRVINKNKEREREKNVLINPRGGGRTHRPKRI